MQEPRQLGIPKHDAVRIFGGNRSLFRRCENAGWIKPVAGSGSGAVYDYQTIETAWKRCVAGDKPESK